MKSFHDFFVLIPILKKCEPVLCWRSISSPLEHPNSLVTNSFHGFVPDPRSQHMSWQDLTPLPFAMIQFNSSNRTITLLKLIPLNMAPPVHSHDFCSVIFQKATLTLGLLRFQIYFEDSKPLLTTTSTVMCIHHEMHNFSIKWVMWTQPKFVPSIQYLI